ncbi:MAG: NAD(P)H-dependent oxidoreductase [Nitrospirota bacterium]|nr:NAD(P)H-dependent oxidoreductase [Nitrospirota bacterium]
MKYLILYAHPNPKSFNHAILETVQTELQKAGREVSLRDLYAQNFNPVLSANDLAGIVQGKLQPEVKAEQEHISSADVIVVIYPLWWSGMPAILKGYIDRVFTDGFAYHISETGIDSLLKSKKVLLITTTGAPQEMYEASGMFKSMAQTTGEGIFQFTGMELIEHKYLCAIPHVTDDDRKKMLEEVKELVQKKLL